MHCIYFDLDGTLLNTRSGIAESIQSALQQLGKPALSDAALLSCFGPPIRDSFARLLGSHDSELIEQATRLFRQHYLDQGIHNYQVYPGIETMLAELSRASFSLKVLTVKPQLQAEWLLQHAGLTELFSSIHGSEYNGDRSDKTAHLQSLLQDNDHPRHRQWMVGDRDSDINAAKANGINSVAVCWGYGESQELQQAASDHLIKHPQELTRLLHSN